VTQVDLPAGTESGLKEATRVLKAVRGIGFIRFEPRDVVRHPLVQSIIQAYERAGRERDSGKGGTSESSREAAGSGTGSTGGDA
jgi:phosphate starvation-inducible PhoH-like protein